MLSMHRRRAAAYVAAAALAVGTVTLVSAPTAPAGLPKPATTYAGVTSGNGHGNQNSGGATVTLDVSADGQSVTRFTVTDMPYNGMEWQPECAGQKFSYTWTGSMPISVKPGYGPTDFSFGNLNINGLDPLVEFEFEGSFQPGTVGGRFWYENPDTNGCSVDSMVGYSASAPGGCQASVEWLTLKQQEASAAAKATKLKKKMAKAKKAGRWGKFFKLKKKRKKALEDFDKARSALTYVCGAQF